jgi:hypothetical protein
MISKIYPYQQYSILTITRGKACRSTSCPFLLQESSPFLLVYLQNYKKNVTATVEVIKFAMTERVCEEGENEKINYHSIILKYCSPSSGNITL